MQSNGAAAARLTLFHTNWAIQKLNFPQLGFAHYNRLILEKILHIIISSQYLCGIHFNSLLVKHKPISKQFPCFDRILFGREFLALRDVAHGRCRALSVVLFDTFVMLRDTIA